MKSKIPGKRMVRLHVLLALLLAMATILLVVNLVDTEGPATEAGSTARPSSRRVLTVGGMHALTVLAAAVVWLNLRRRARDLRRLRRSEQKHRAIINHAAEAIVLLDHERRVWEWNKAAERLFGAGRRTVLGRPLREIPLSQGPELDRAIQVAQKNGRSLTLEVPWRRIQNPDGSIRLTISPLPQGRGTDDPQDRLFVVLARDVTREQQLESRMSQAEKLAGIGQLAAGIAHQLNTPLGSILLSAQMLAEGELPEDQAEDVERIIRQTEQCRQIIKGLLNFARPRHNERTRMLLNDAVHETVYLVEKNLRAAGVAVTINQTGPLEVMGNRNELDQVFFNLLVNAVDAMPNGGRITIDLSPGDPGEILVSFADTGPGIPPALSEQVFLPFYTTKDYGKGTGLGLSIVARIMHEHGGRIDLDETYSEGARFLLSFPLPGLGLESSSSSLAGAPLAEEKES